MKLANMASRSWGRLAFLTFVVTAAGCGSQDLGPSSLNPPVEAAQEAKVRAVADDFFKSAQSGDSHIAALLSPKSKLKAADFGKSSPLYGPFVGASALVVDSVGSSVGGKKLVARAHFTGADGKTYRSNVTMEVSGESLLVDAVSVPSFATKPVQSGAGASQSPL